MHQCSCTISKHMHTHTHTNVQLSFEVRGNIQTECILLKFEHLHEQLSYCTIRPPLAHHHGCVLSLLYIICMLCKPFSSTSLLLAPDTVGIHGNPQRGSQNAARVICQDILGQSSKRGINQALQQHICIYSICCEFPFHWKSITGAPAEQKLSRNCCLLWG